MIKLKFAFLPILWGACSLTHGMRVGTPLDLLSAVNSSDVTALIEGCGEQLSVGFIVCRKTEGETSDEALTFVGPPTKCQGELPCVTFKIFLSDGAPSLGDSIPRGQTRRDISWKKILKRDNFEFNDRGIWEYAYTIRYLDEEGIERTTYSQGEIYLRVLKKGYIPLHSTREDPLFFWKWKEHGLQIKATTGMRTFVERKMNP